MPFYHRKSEPFWKLIPNHGFGKWIESRSSMRSLNNLTTAVKFASIDKDLVTLLLNDESHDLLKIKILEKYFNITQLKYDKNDNLLNISILNDSSESYKRKIIELKNKVSENEFKEEIFIRGGLFKREIPKIYN